jgi:hypothetical protein
VEKIQVAIQKCTTVVDHVGSQFKYYLLTFLEKLYFKLQKFITYSYNIQIIHVLVHWNPVENGEKTHKFVHRFNNSK